MSRFVTRKLLLVFRKPDFSEVQNSRKVIYGRHGSFFFLAVIKTGHSGPLPNVFNLEVSKEL